MREQGRPTKYHPEYDKLAYKLALLGLTDIEIAEIFEVTEKTLNNWKHQHPSFLQSLKNGKEIADAEVAVKLHERATGYTHKETKSFVIDGKIVDHEVDKHYPPDPASMAMWLKNRQHIRWAKLERKRDDEDKHTIIIQNGKELPEDD